MGCWAGMCALADSPGRIFFNYNFLYKNVHHTEVKGRGHMVIRNEVDGSSSPLTLSQAVLA